MSQGQNHLGKHSARQLTLKFHRGTLSLDPKPDNFLEKRDKKFPVQIKYDARVPIWRSDPIHYQTIRETLLNEKVQLDDQVARWQNDVTLPQVSLPQMRPEQQEAIQDRAGEKLRVLEDIFRLHLGESVIIFAGTNVMAREISCRFLIPCLLNHCKKNERMDILDGFRDGRYPALVANQVLDEGVDIPAAKIAVVVGGMGSTRQAKQRLGRILRKSGNKQGVLYEVVCDDTGEVKQSRQRRSSDAYQGTRHRRI